MTYSIIGVALMLLEAYRLFIPQYRALAVPLAFGVGIPLLIAASSLKRPTAERPTILVMAVAFAVSLNRDVLGSPVVALSGVVVCAAFMVWSGVVLRRGRTTSSFGLGLVLVLVIGGFLLSWLLRMM
jgi:hypothetical protein